MAQSGVTVSSEVQPIFLEIKQKKQNPPVELLYIQFKITDDNANIVFEKKAETSRQGGMDLEKAKQEWDDFVGQLPADDCRYSVYDLAFELKGGQKRQKLLFIHWAPDSAAVKKKMIYASSKDAIKKALVGIHFEFQGSDASDLAFDEILERIKSKEHV